MNAEFEIKVFEYGGKEPYTDWILSLDAVVRNRILTRIARLQVGNFGDCKKIDNNISELRCFFGSGYRLYFGKDQDKKIVILLCAGDKGSQSKDIKRAKQYWKEWKRQVKK